MTYSTYETMHDTPMHLGLLCLSAFFFLCDRLLLIMISIISVFPSQFQTVSHCSHRHIFRGARFVIALVPIFINLHNIYIYIFKDFFLFFCLVAWLSILTGYSAVLFLESAHRISVYLFFSLHRRLWTVFINRVFVFPDGVFLARHCRLQVYTFNKHASIYLAISLSHSRSV